MTPKILAGNLGRYFKKFVKHIFNLEYDENPDYE